MSDKFLLYIDILGFAEMTKREPRKVARIYSILDQLNVHRHKAFNTIVFSDTVLVYNPQDAQSEEEKNYLVWYLIEFVEDLHHRLTGQDIYFRAILTKGSFLHYELSNISCFYGEALVKAYLKEKDIPSLGLFIDHECNKHNKYFRTSAYDDSVSFVYLNRSLETLNTLSAGAYPLNYDNLSTETPYTPWQVRFLRDVYEKMRGHPSPAVRVKFLNAWDFYAKRYPNMLHALTQNNFSLESLARPGAWAESEIEMQRSIKYNKRIGSGTDLSVQVSKSKNNRKSKASSKS